MNRVVTILSILLLALAPAQAPADIFAAVNVAAPGSRTDLDVAIVNASLGTRVSLPSSVNTTASEIHPSISSDGQRLLFRRSGGSGGLFLVDTFTGDSATLFSALETLTSPIFNSEITKDGTTVLTGRRFREVSLSSGTRYHPQVTVSNVSAFPTGPYPRLNLSSPTPFSSSGRTTDVSYSDGVYALRVLVGSSPLGVIVMWGPGSPVPFVLSRSSTDYGHPGVVSAAMVDFDRRQLLDNLPDSDSDIGGYSRITTSLSSEGEFGYPASINTEADESQPARMGRYLAFVRHGSDGHDRLFVFDRTTRTFLNPSGVDLGVVATRGIGSVSLYERAVLTASRITLTGTVTATLASASSIGILVQRIVGATLERGQKHYELEPVGRVPLGFFHTGKIETQWDLAVAGEPLSPGRYLVTLRAVEGDVVRELGESRVLQIGKKHPPKGDIR